MFGSTSVIDELLMERERERGRRDRNESLISRHRERERERERVLGVVAEVGGESELIKGVWA